VFALPVYVSLMVRSVTALCAPATPPAPGQAHKLAFLLACRKPRMGVCVAEWVGVNAL